MSTLATSILFQRWQHHEGDRHEFITHTGLAGIATSGENTLDIHRVGLFTEDDMESLGNLVEVAKLHWIGLLLARHGFYNATLTPIDGGPALRGFMWRKGWDK